MATLHTVSRSPYRETALGSCLRVALPGSAVLLLEDGVYAALAAGEASAPLRASMEYVKVFVLGADLQARGLGNAPLLPGIHVVDYGGFVDLACEHDKVQAWF